MTVPHYGKRAAGLLTAASPGDTLHFQFASYNDSGDSEALSGFAVTDIEVFKNGIAATRTTDSGYSLISDTGQIGDRVGLYRFSVQLFNTADDTGHYESGAWYQVAVDGVVIDGKTVRLWVGSFEIGEPRANVVQLGGDTGALNWLRQTFASGFSDTGINQRLAQIQSDVDTGLRVHIDDSDTGVKDTIADLDTGIRALLTLRDTGAIASAVWSFATRSVTNIADTGIVNSLAIIRADLDTGLLNADVLRIRGDTGGADRFYRYTQKLDTGGDATVSASVDTGVVNQAVWQGNATRSVTNVADTGIVNSLQIIRSDVDTGLRTHIDDSDTGVKDAIADFDTGVRALLALRDTGAVANAVWNFATRSVTNIADTGIVNSLAIIRADTDTGIQGGVTVTGFSDTGINDRLAKILADTDTGIQSGVAVTAITDTGIYSQIAALATASTLSTVSSNVSSIKTQTDKLLFDTGGEVRADIRRVNNITVQGTGDTGTSDYWRPGT